MKRNEATTWGFIVLVILTLVSVLWLAESIMGGA